MIKKNDDVEIEQSEEHSDAFAVRKWFNILYFINLNEIFYEKRPIMLMTMMKIIL